jgi:hypothetical protein
MSELEKARAETERLRNALREIAERNFEWASSNEARIIEGTFRAMAREALEP